MSKQSGMNKSLPSSDAVAEVLEGKDGAIGKMVASTLLRSILIAPGLIIVGVDGKKAVIGSVASSVMITGFILLYLKYNQSKPKTSVGTQLTKHSTSSLLGRQRHPRYRRAG